MKQETKLFDDPFTGCTKTKLKRDVDGLKMSLDDALMLQKRGDETRRFYGWFYYWQNEDSGKFKTSKLEKDHLLMY